MVVPARSEEVTSYDGAVSFWCRGAALWVYFSLASGLACSLVSCSLVWCSLAWPSPVRAQRSDEAGPAGAEAGEPAAAGRGRVGVVLLPRGAASPDMADSLTELLIAAIASRGAVEIVGKEEFQAALGRDDEGTLACIESDACLGRMGRELGVEELVAGTVSTERMEGSAELGRAEVGEHFRFELYRLDVENGSALGRVAREVDGGFSALLSALTTSVDELYVERIEPGAIVVSAVPTNATVSLDTEPLPVVRDGSFRRGFLVPGLHRLTARAAGHEPLTREVEIEPGTTLMLSLELERRAESLFVSTTTAVLAGAGVAILGSALGVGLSSQTERDVSLNMRQSREFFEARELEANVANVLFAVGGGCLVAAVVSLVLDLTSSDDDASEPEASRVMRGEVARW